MRHRLTIAGPGVNVVCAFQGWIVGNPVDIGGRTALRDRRLRVVADGIARRTDPEGQPVDVQAIGVAGGAGAGRFVLFVKLMTTQSPPLARMANGWSGSSRRPIESEPGPAAT